MTSIILAFWVFYIGFEAIRTAEYNHRLRSYFIQETLLFNFITRTIVFCITIFAYYKFTDRVYLLVLCQILLTPFLYEGQYACKRNDLDRTVYKDRVLSNIYSDESIFRVPYQIRIIMVILSLCTYLYFLCT